MTNTLRRVAATLAAIVALTLGLAVAATPAQAAGCHTFSMPQPTGLDVNMNYTAWMYVSTTSTCHDIQIKNLNLPNCGPMPGHDFPGVYMWLHFDPTMGAPDFYSDATFVLCGSSSYRVLAYDVLNNTRYRVERYIGTGDPGMSATIMD